MTLRRGNSYSIATATSGNQGSATFTGEAVGTISGSKTPYTFFANLTGQSLQGPSATDIPFTMSGTLTQTKGPNPDQGTIGFGFSPKLTISGRFSQPTPTDTNATLKMHISLAQLAVTGNSDAGSNPKETDYYCCNASSSSDVSSSALHPLVLNTSINGVPLELKVPVPPAFKMALVAATPPPAGGGAAPGGSGASGKASAGGAGGGAGGGSTQFSIYENFQLSYGLNGGPTWTLIHFKGPAGATTPLLSASRADSDSLTMTLVAACRQGQTNILRPLDYWQTIPVCDSAGALVAVAGQIGAAANLFRTAPSLIGRP